MSVKMFKFRLSQAKYNIKTIRRLSDKKNKTSIRKLDVKTNSNYTPKPKSKTSVDEIFKIKYLLLKEVCRT